MAAVGVHVALPLGDGAHHRQVLALQLLLVLPQGLVQQLDHPDLLPVHRQGPCGGLAGLHKILGELLEPLGLPVQHVDVLPGGGVGLLRGLQEVHIVDDGGEGGLQVVGHVGDELRLEALALHLLIHRLGQTAGDVVQGLGVALQIPGQAGRVDLVVQVAGGNDLRPLAHPPEAGAPPAQKRQHRQVDHHSGHRIPIMEGPQVVTGKDGGQI